VSSHEHSELSLTHSINSTDKPLNCFQNQQVLDKARSPLKRRFILFANVPPLLGVSSGQIERFHSTLSELSQCLSTDSGITDTVEIVLLAVTIHNKSIHSVIGDQPMQKWGYRRRNLVSLRKASAS